MLVDPETVHVLRLLSCLGNSDIPIPRQIGFACEEFKLRSCIIFTFYRFGTRHMTECQETLCTGHSERGKSQKS